MNCEVSVSIVSISGVQYYYPSVDLNNLFDSIEPDEHDPEGIVVSIEGAKFRTKPENVHIGITLAEMSHVFEQMSDEHIQTIENIVDDLCNMGMESTIKIVPPPETEGNTECEACSLEPYIIGCDMGKEDDENGN
jgi:hypothetical protein